MTASILIFLIFAYSGYQLKRNFEIGKIKQMWIEKEDKRFKIHTYDEMFEPAKENWYGLKYPKDKHFK